MNEKKKCQKTCEHCYDFRIKSDEFGICDSENNATKTMPVDFIKHLTGCDEEIAMEINESIRFHKEFGCIHFKPYPKK